MPLIQGQTSIAASSVNDNILAGSQFEYAPYNAVVDFGLVGDTNGADLRIDVYTGQDVLAENMEPSAQNRIPISPDDYTLQDVVRGGERIKVRVRNTNAAAARVLFHAIRITPL